MRTRKQLVHEHVRHVQRIQKTLESANIKPDPVSTDFMGVSGRRMIEAMVAGVRNPDKLARLADMLRLHMSRYDAIGAALAQVDGEVADVIARMDEEADEVGATSQSLISRLCAGAMRMGRSRKKDSYYQAQFKRLRAKHCPKRAICAVAASMLTAIYHRLTRGIAHQDLGVGYFDHRSTEVKAKRLVATLATLGYRAELLPMPKAA